MNEDVQKALNILAESIDVHFKVGKKMVEPGETYLFPLDFLANAVLHRSVNLVRGFSEMIKTENFICAAPLLRFQIDNLLRFFAATLVNDPHDFATKVMQGNQIRNLKDKNGNKMTDRYLVDNFPQHQSVIDKLYTVTSGYVHLSDEHIRNSFKIVGDMKVEMVIKNRDEYIPLETKLNAIDSMSQVTKLLLSLLNSWAVQKRSPETKK